jgi:transposase
VLCVAIDYAKRKHVALICDGHGDILKKPFTVDNTREGVDYFIEQVAATARHRKIPENQIFLGGEDEPSYVANFTAALRGRDYLVMRVNAYQAKESRANLVANTDQLALLGIAKTLLSRRAKASGRPNSDAVYYHIREISRARRSLVRQQTAVANRIHTLIDQLCPGFLDDSKSGLTALCAASIELMKDRFSAPELARRKSSALAKTLRRQGIHKPDEIAAKIIALARSALPPAPERVATLQRTLAASVDLYECLRGNAAALRVEAAQVLLTTPYALLTSIPGIGFVLASGGAGELGDPALLRATDSLCAYSGIVPKTYQTGGPDSPATQGHATPRCNRILKDWIVQSAQKIQLYGPPELKARITRWNANGQHGIYAAARRYLRLLRSLVKNQVPYLAPSGRDRQATPDERAAAIRDTWKVMQNKWRTIPGALDLMQDETHPIGLWRRVVKEVHGIDLSPRP